MCSYMSNFSQPPKNLCTLLSCPMLNCVLKYPLNKCQPQDFIGHLIQIALAVIFQMQWLLSLFLRLSRMQMNRFCCCCCCCCCCFSHCK